MAPIDLEKLLNKIAWGARYIKVKDLNDTEVILKIKDLDLNDRVWIDFIYEQAITEAKEANLLSERELAIFLEQQGVWTSEDEKDIKNHIISIAKLNDEMESEDISKRDKRKLSRVIAGVEQSLNKKKTKRSLHFSNCLERYADDERIKAILFCVSARTNTDDRFWKTWEIFCEESDHVLINNVISELSKSKPLSIEEIRYLARSPLWRSKWLASKNCDDLFGKPIVELTRNQESLVYWSQVYDNVYESIDRPSQEIIDDDIALDKWFQRQKNKRDVESINSSGKNSFGIGSNINRHGEIGVVANKNLLRTESPAAKGWGGGEELPTPSVQTINDLNDPISKKFLQVQRKKLKKAGVIREQDLRLDSDSRRVIGSTDNVYEKRKRADGLTGKATTKRYQGGTLKGRRLE